MADGNSSVGSYFGFPTAEWKDTQEAFRLWSSQIGSAGVNGIYKKKR